jgi:hypothetical protein
VKGRFFLPLSIHQEAFMIPELHTNCTLIFARTHLRDIILLQTLLSHVLPFQLTIVFELLSKLEIVFQRTLLNEISYNALIANSSHIANQPNGECVKSRDHLDVFAFLYQVQTPLYDSSFLNVSAVSIKFEFD